MKKIILSMLILLFAIGIASGCMGNDSTTDVSEARLSATAISIKMGDTTQLSVLDYVGDVKWSSSDESIAIVSENGNVTAEAIGSSAVSAQLDDGTRKTCVVNVEPGISQIQSIKVSGLYSDANDITVNYNDSDSVLLRASCIPDVNEKLIWKSSDERIAMVDSNGNVTVYKNGIAKISAMAINGVEGVCTIRVKNAPENLQPPVIEQSEDVEDTYEDIPVVETDKKASKFTSPVPISSPSAKTSVIVSDKNVYLNVGESFKLTYAVGNTSSSDVTWQSSDKAVAIVSEGRIVAIGEGRCTISVVTGDGAVASSLVAVGRDEIKKMKKEVSDAKK